MAMNNHKTYELVKDNILTIKEHNETYFKLYKLGVDLIDYADKVSDQLYKSTVTLLESLVQNENLLPHVDEYLGEWLFSDIRPNILYFNFGKPDQTEIDITDIEDFLEYMTRPLVVTDTTTPLTKEDLLNVSWFLVNPTLQDDKALTDMGMYIGKTLKNPDDGEGKAYVYDSICEEVVDIWFYPSLRESMREYEITRIDDKFYFKYKTTESGIRI